MRLSLPELRDRVALVTGAASGIGRATALRLADHGAHLILCDINEAGLAAVAEAVAQRSRCLLARRVDVASRDAMRAFATEVHAQVPAVDLLVNNAGVGLAGGLLTTSLEDWEWVLSINLWGVIHGLHFFVPAMVARGAGGYVVNVSSLLGYFAAPELIGYTTSKFAVFGLSESLRAELRPHRIGVSVICPGVIDTGIVGQTRISSSIPNSDKLRARVSKMYQRRNYGPDKVACAIVQAVRSGRPVVPVTPEAWGLYYVSRFLPALGPRIGRLMRRRAMGADS